MTTTGRIVGEIDPRTSGDFVAVAAAAGATTLAVNESVDFSDEGGLLVIGDSTDPITYLRKDEDTHVLTLAAPGLPVAVEVGDPVNLWDAAIGAPVTEYVAKVAVDGHPQGIDFTVPPGRAPQMVAGTQVDLDDEEVLGAIDQASVLRFWDRDGNLTLGIDGETGSITMKGDLTSGSTITGASIIGSIFKTNTGFDDIEITPGNSSTPSAITFYSDAFKANPDAPASLSTFDFIDTFGGTTFNRIRTRLAGAQFVDSTNAPRIDVTTYRSQATAAVASNIEYHATDHELFCDGVNIVLISSSGISTKAVYADTGLHDRTYVGGGNTGASINDNGRIVRSTSSQRYKRSITPISREEWSPVLSVVGHRFKYRPEMDMGDRWMPGLIAEQVEEAGASLWVTYDREGRPDGVRYAELTAALIEVCKDQEARIVALEGAPGDRPRREPR